MSTTSGPQMSFAQQRLVFLGVLAGVVVFAVVVAVVLQQNGGRGVADEPIAVLDTVAVLAAFSFAGAAFMVRRLLTAVAEKTEPSRRAPARFLATLVPLAILEGGSLFALTVWLLNGSALPNLVVAATLLAIAFLLVPFSDPDAS